MREPPNPNTHPLYASTQSMRTTKKIDTPTYLPTYLPTAPTSTEYPVKHNAKARGRDAWKKSKVW